MRTGEEGVDVRSHLITPYKWGADAFCCCIGSVIVSSISCEHLDNDLFARRLRAHHLLIREEIAYETDALIAGFASVHCLHLHHAPGSVYECRHAVSTRSERAEKKNSFETQSPEIIIHFCAAPIICFMEKSVQTSKKVK